MSSMIALFVTISLYVVLIACSLVLEFNYMVRCYFSLNLSFSRMLGTLISFISFHTKVLALISMEAFLLYVRDLSRSHQFQDEDLRYCLSDSARCLNSRASHSVASMHSIGVPTCTEDGQSCVDITHLDVSFFALHSDHFIYNEELQNLVVPNTHDCFPSLDALAVLCGVNFLFCLLCDGPLKGVNIISNFTECHGNNRNTVVRIMSLLSLIVFALSIGAARAYAYFFTEECDSTRFRDICDALHENDLKIHSLNTSSNTAARHYDIFVIAAASMLLFGTLLQLCEPDDEVEWYFSHDTDGLEEPFPKPSKSEVAALLEPLVSPCGPGDTTAIDRVCAVCLDCMVTQLAVPCAINHPVDCNSCRFQTDDIHLDANLTGLTGEFTNKQSICHDPVQLVVQRLISCPCGHTFHYECMEAWVRSRSRQSVPSCPECRQPIIVTRGSSY